MEWGSANEEEAGPDCGVRGIGEGDDGGDDEVGYFGVVWWLLLLEVVEMKDRKGRWVDKGEGEGNKGIRIESLLFLVVRRGCIL